MHKTCWNNWCELMCWYNLATHPTAVGGSKAVRCRPSGILSGTCFRHNLTPLPCRLLNEHLTLRFLLQRRNKNQELHTSQVVSSITSAGNLWWRSKTVVKWGFEVFCLTILKCNKCNLNLADKVVLISIVYYRCYIYLWLWPHKFIMISFWVLKAKIWFLTDYIFWNSYFDS